MRLWLLLLISILSAALLVPARAGTWPVEAEDDDGVIDRQALLEQDRGLQAQLDSLYEQIGGRLQEEIHVSRADSLDSLQVACAVQRLEMFRESMQGWAAYCSATARSVFLAYCGGSIAGAAERQFRIDLIVARLQELREIYSVEAGPPEDVMAVTRLLFAAGRGDAQAQCDLGKMHYAGNGVPVDHEEAFRYYHQAADAGNAEAQDLLGMAYAEGDGVPQDYAEALKWYRLAAARGDTNAFWHLGTMYEHGTGVPQDCTEAVRWYRLGADRGNGYAQAILAIAYDKGECIPQDLVQAHMWYSLSAERIEPGDPRALAARSRDKVAAKMTPAQIAEAQRLARAWKPQ